MILFVGIFLLLLCLAVIVVPATLVMVEQGGWRMAVSVWGATLAILILVFLGAYLTARGVT